MTEISMSHRLQHVILLGLVSLCVGAIALSGSNRQATEQKRWIAERIAKNEAFEAFCQSQDCDQFPVGHLSARLVDRWYYIPFRKPGYSENSEKPACTLGPFGVSPLKGEPSYAQFENVESFEFRKIVQPNAAEVGLRTGACSALESVLPAAPGWRQLLWSSIDLTPGTLLSPDGLERWENVEGYTPYEEGILLKRFPFKDSAHKRLRGLIHTDESIGMLIRFTCAGPSQSGAVPPYHECEIHSARYKHTSFPRFRIRDLRVPACVEETCDEEAHERTLVSGVVQSIENLERLIAYFEQNKTVED